MTQNLSKVPNCHGTMILNTEGAVVQSSGELENQEKLAKHFYAMAIKVNMFLNKAEQKFRKISVNYNDAVYMLTCVGDSIYVVKRKPTPQQEPVHA